MVGNQIKTAPDLGFALRAERERQGLTQSELSIRADVSVRWLSNFERGKAPRAELIKVMHVARALGLAFELAQEAAPAKRPTNHPFPNYSAMGLFASGGAGQSLAAKSYAQRFAMGAAQREEDVTEATGEGAESRVEGDDVGQA